MKKLMAVVLTLISILGLAGCSSTKNFEIQNVDKIVIRSGSTGKTVEVTNADVIQQITNSINSVSFERGKSSKNYDGWSYNIRWYDSNDVEVESITVQGNGTINYDDYFWNSLDGSIDTAFLEELLKED